MTDEELLSILNNPDYIDQILSADTSEKLYDVLKSKNIIISHENAKNIFNQIMKYKNNDLEQLNDSQLLNLSSGGNWSTYRKIVTTIPYYTGYAVGRAPIIGLAIYSAIKGAKDQLKNIF